MTTLTAKEKYFVPWKAQAWWRSFTLSVGIFHILTICQIVRKFSGSREAPLICFVILVKSADLDAFEGNFEILRDVTQSVLLVN